MPRFSLTISDISNDEAGSILAHAKRLEAGDLPAKAIEAAESADAAKPVRVKKAAPSALPAAASPAAAPAPAAAPNTGPVGVVAAPSAPLPDPMGAPAPAAAPIAAPLPAGDGRTIASLTAKAKQLAASPLKQFALLAVLNAMSVPQLNKVPPQQFEVFDNLLDAAIGYSALPGATLEGLKAACQPGQYDAATTLLQGAVAKSMGL